MHLAQLDDVEQLAFVGLAKLMVHADLQLSDHESNLLAKIADELGRARWNQRVQEAQTSLPDAKAVFELARGLTRPEAQETIYDHLAELADADDRSDHEAEILDWLAAVWGLEDADSDEIDPETAVVDQLDDLSEEMVITHGDEDE